MEDLPGADGRPPRVVGSGLDVQRGVTNHLPGVVCPQAAQKLRVPGSVGVVVIKPLRPANCKERLKMKRAHCGRRPT